MGALHEIQTPKGTSCFYTPVSTEPRWYWPRRMRTDFLFPNLSFLSGVASVINLPGDVGLYNHSRTGEEADIKALYSDYRMIFQDIEDAMRAFDAESSLQERLFDPDQTKPAS
jgi:hypothetical protein